MSPTTDKGYSNEPQPRSAGAYERNSAYQALVEGWYFGPQGIYFMWTRGRLRVFSVDGSLYELKCDGEGMFLTARGTKWRYLGEMPIGHRWSFGIDHGWYEAKVTSAPTMTRALKQATGYYGEAERKEVIDWYEKAKKEEVKKKMYLQLIDVIFFNWKTKEIDYRKNVVAKDTEEAYMVAAQDFGKYDCKVHIRRATCILSFDETGKEA